jgi:hypothetical protein
MSENMRGKGVFAPNPHKCVIPGLSGAMVPTTDPGDFSFVPVKAVPVMWHEE